MSDMEKLGILAPDEVEELRLMAADVKRERRILEALEAIITARAKAVIASRGIDPETCEIDLDKGLITRARSLEEVA